MNLSLDLIALNVAINLSAKLASDKLHCADFVHNPPKITAVAQNHVDGQESRHTPKITAFTVIVTP